MKGGRELFTIMSVGLQLADGGKYQCKISTNAYFRGDAEVIVLGMTYVHF